MCVDRGSRGEAPSRESSGRPSVLRFPSGGLECLPKIPWVHSFVSSVDLDRGYSEPGPVLMTGDTVTETQLLPLTVDRKDRDMKGHLELRAQSVFG